MPKKPTTTIRQPGKAAPADQAEQRPADERIALTVKVSPDVYERLMAVKARRKARHERVSTQSLLEDAVRALLSNEGE